MKMRTLFSCFSLLAVLLMSFNSMANTDLTFGHSETITSKILGEERTLYISLPQGYEQSKQQRYPVLYTLDGEAHFKRVVGTVEWLNRDSQVLPSTIIVAITNTKRFRDFTPTVPKGEEGNAGGAANFLKFMTDELIPHIDKKYRTNKQRTLAGHSMAGLFTLYAMMEKGDLFQGYIAQSPWILFDDMTLVKRFERELGKKKSMPVMLYMSIGSEPNLDSAYKRLEKAIKNNAPENMIWHSKFYKEEGHMSVASVTLHDGLTAFSRFNGWTLSPEVIEQGLPAIKATMVQINARSNEKVKAPEMSLNNLGYALLYRNKVKKAIEVFEYAIGQYPESANAYDSLAEAYGMDNRYTEAARMLEKGIALAQSQNHRGLPFMQEHLKRVQAKL